MSEFSHNPAGGEWSRHYLGIADDIAATAYEHGWRTEGGIYVFGYSPATRRLTCTIPQMLAPLDTAPPLALTLDSPSAHFRRVLQEQIGPTPRHDMVAFTVYNPVDAIEHSRNGVAVTLVANGEEEAVFEGSITYEQFNSTLDLGRVLERSITKTARRRLGEWALNFFESYVSAAYQQHPRWPGGPTGLV
jgi:hypothetical protein